MLSSFFIGLYGCHYCRRVRTAKCFLFHVLLLSDNTAIYTTSKKPQLSALPFQSGLLIIPVLLAFLYEQGLRVHIHFLVERVVAAAKAQIEKKR